LNVIQAKGLDHVVLRVRDLEPAIRFYRDVLGFPVERRLDDFGLVQLRAGSSLIDLVDVDSPLGRAGGGQPDTDRPNMDHFALTLDAFDEDAIRAHLDQFGVEAEQTRRLYGAEGFGPSIYLRDPDGNRVELKGPADASDPPGAAES
jgi:glyoxylase I family protein